MAGEGGFEGVCIGLVEERRFEQVGILVTDEVKIRVGGV
jgi:hypothetical protein